MTHGNDDQLIDEVRIRFNEKYRRGDAPWMRPAVAPMVHDFVQLLIGQNSHPILLDLGCGNGWISIILAQQGIEVHGIDGSEIAITEANRRKTEAALENCHFEVGNGLDFPYADGQFDAVFDRGFLHHIPESAWSTYLAGLLRVLKPNGFFYLECFSEQSEKKGFYPQRDDGYSHTSFDDQTGYRTHDEFFTRERVMDLFGHHFTVVNEDKETTRSKDGAVMRFLIFRRK